jgi:FixJ family two-component response regulator
MSDTAPVVAVIDDDPSVRKALGRLLKTAGFGVELFATADEFLARPDPDGLSCAVLDVRLPGLSGLDLQRALAERDAGLPIIFITGHGDIPMTVRAMKAGAVDFLPKPFDPDDLLAAVGQAVARHAAARRAASEAAAVRQRADALSPRERQVMACVVSGLANKQVAHQLGIALKTVKVHRAQVMRKMRADSLPDLVRLAGRLAGESPAPTPARRGTSVAASARGRPAWP